METPFSAVPSSHRNPQDQRQEQAEHLKNSLELAKKRLEKSDQKLDILLAEQETLLSRPFIQKMSDGSPIDPSTIPQEEKRRLHRLATIEEDIFEAAIEREHSEGEVLDLGSQLEETENVPSSPSEEINQPHSA